MRFDRFGPIDTPREVEEKLYEILRTKTPEESLAMVLKRMEFARDLYKRTAHLRKPEPDADI